MPDEKNKKKSFVLRMDPQTFQQLEKWAADEFRSLNGQIEYLLHRALQERGRRKPGPDQGTDSEKLGR